MKRADAFNVESAFNVRRSLRRELRQLVNANIRKELADRDMSETQLANAIGMTQTSVWRRFAGESNWEFGDLETVAKVLKTSVKHLVTEP